MALRTAGNRLTYRDYQRFPDDGQRHELIDGQHYVNPSPEFDHQMVSKRMQRQLEAQIEAPDLGVVVNAPMDVRLSRHDVVQPDLIVVLRANTEVSLRPRIQGAPDLLIEVLSPSTRSHDRVRKRAAYARFGVREYWVVDPRKRMVEQFVLVGRKYVPVAHPDDSLTLRCLPSVRVDLSRVWESAH